MPASCSRPACPGSPVATLTYDYTGRVATLGGLAPDHPMHYDLCAAHADRLSVPNGWRLLDRRGAGVAGLAPAAAPVEPGRLAS